MITIYTLEEIRGLENVTKAMKEELLKYFQEIAESIAGEEWEKYNLEEVGPILVIEDEDTIAVLDEYGLMQGNKAIPEFALSYSFSAKINYKKIVGNKKYKNEI